MSPQVGVRAGQLTVERAVVATLKLWLPTYVVEAARRYASEGISDFTPESMEEALASGAFPYRPRGISVASTFQDWDTTALPQIKVVSPSWSKIGGDETGDHIVYDIQVGAVVGAQETEDTRLARAVFEDGIPGVLRQHQRLGGLAAAVEVVGGGSTHVSETDDKDSRTLQASATVLTVLVMGVIDPRNGPSEPLDPGNEVPPPYPQDPLLNEANLDYEPEAIT